MPDASEPRRWLLCEDIDGAWFVPDEATGARGAVEVVEAAPVLAEIEDLLGQLAVSVPLAEVSGADALFCVECLAPYRVSCSHRGHRYVALGEIVAGNRPILRTMPAGADGDGEDKR
jgi:hypothetical protein